MRSVKRASPSGIVLRVSTNHSFNFTWQKPLLPKFDVLLTARRLALPARPLHRAGADRRHLLLFPPMVAVDHRLAGTPSTRPVALATPATPLKTTTQPPLDPALLMMFLRAMADRVRLFPRRSERGCYFPLQPWAKYIMFPFLLFAPLTDSPLRH